MLIMEYMDHGSLYDLLQNNTVCLDGEQILFILRDLAQGLRFLHSANPQVVHGDLKARNISVDSRLRAKVADFGLSEKKRLGATGTPYWMAPELLRRETTNTTQSDMYAVGIILYEVYARKNPYEGEDLASVLGKVLDNMVSKRPPTPEGCPVEMERLMKKCWDKDPAKRPSCRELDMKLKSLNAARVEPTRRSVSMQRVKNTGGTDGLLEEVFPAHVAEALRNGEKVEPETREEVTIVFSDIVGFTNIASSLSAMKISDMLDRLYTKFDEISHKHDVFKVETIGDSWMGVTNLSKDQPDHAARIVAFSVDAMRAAQDTWIDPSAPTLGRVNLRIGMHSGPVVANVVGSRNPRYCLFGDSVNTASRMESLSEAGRIQCSSFTAQLLMDQNPQLQVSRRGKITVKGKGKMETYWVAQDLLSPDDHHQEEGTTSTVFVNETKSDGSLEDRNGIPLVTTTVAVGVSSTSNKSVKFQDIPEQAPPVRAIPTNNIRGASHDEIV